MLPLVSYCPLSQSHLASWSFCFFVNYCRFCDLLVQNKYDPPFFIRLWFQTSHNKNWLAGTTTTRSSSLSSFTLATYLIWKHDRPSLAPGLSVLGYYRNIVVQQGYVDVNGSFYCNETKRYLFWGGLYYVMSSSVTALSLFQGVAGFAAGANPSCLLAKAGYTLDKLPAHSRALRSNLRFSFLLKDTLTYSSAQPGGAWIWTSDFPITSRPALPSELQPPWD